MKTKAKILSLLLLALVVPIWGHTLVSLQNGNYYLEIEPVEIPKIAGVDFGLLIGYNSRSTFTGLFGFGFGTQYETRLQPMPDGSVMITEYGGADGYRYAPATDNPRVIAAAVQRLLSAAGKSGDKVLERRLLESPEERASWFARHNIKTEIPEGAILKNSGRPQESVRRIKQGFVREFSSGGRQEYYDNFGRLYQIQDNQGSFVAITYDPKTGRISSLRDKAGRRIQFATNASGRVTEVWTSLAQSRRAKLGYDERQRLVSYQDSLGEKVTFGYDAVGNITSVTWDADKSRELIEYSPTRDYVTKVTDRSGMVTTYRQERNAQDPSGYLKQTVTVQRPNQPAEQRTYEFWFKNRPNGERYKFRQRSLIGGEAITTVFNECCGKPIEEVSSTKGRTTYEYNTAGLLTRQVLPDGSSKAYTYHPTLGRVTSITEVFPGPGGKPVTTWVRVAYDERTGNIRGVANSDQQNLTLRYDNQGRIIAIVDAKKNEINFAYNNVGLPVRITQKGVGSVQLSYDAQGNVQGADSPQGRVVAMRVSQLMQNLLSVVRPLGISLGP